ncbi:hypothetical protein [Lyngbya aestuarii]|uniref:hypothetical protein n=1 Tax=Lyngbya aestuarii TaxID=118322 RepID=UPI00403DD410
MTNPNQRIETDNYDRGITPAETAARIEREGQQYKHTPEKEGEIDTTSGYTTDKEGLLNNYAIEPEMYVDEPGDLREEEEQRTAERNEELKEMNQTDEQGKLTMEKDSRGKGTGII